MVLDGLFLLSPFDLNGDHTDKSSIVSAISSKQCCRLVIGGVFGIKEEIFSYENNDDKFRFKSAG